MSETLTPVLPGLFGRDRDPLTPRQRTIVDTSRLAFERILADLNRQQVAVLLALADYDRAGGLTGGELAEAMGLDKCSVRPRLTELFEQGLVDKLTARRSRVRSETICHPYRALVSAATLARVRPNGGA